ncbi:MAG TPA: MTH938/NDUFAF3 family protein [Bacteroidales bacterium]|nr:MTH938/NDUFAF3 family protein [Bacteroidales bacterium]
MIQEYRFGKMVIDGKPYDQDLIIADGEVLSNWWREKGHNLLVKDIEKVLNTHNPDIIVVGKGQFGMMGISDEVKKHLHNQGIELIHKKTGKAVQIFNKYYNEGKKVIGAFHLTC